MLSKPSLSPRGILDLGELAAQYLAMAINPYPRVEGAAWDALSTEESAEQEIPKAVNPFLKLVKGNN